MLRSRFLKLWSAAFAGALLLTPFFAFALTDPNAFPLVVSVVSPTAGQPVSGELQVRASASQTVGSLSFTIFTVDQAGGEAAVAVLPASPEDANGMSWRATWPSASAPNGGYFVRAVATQSDGRTTASSAPIGFSVANGGEQTVPPQNNALTITVIEPAIGATTSGNSVAFRAQTSTGAPSLSFLITGATNASLNATGDAGGTIWTAHWDSTAAQNGTYSVTGRVQQVTGATTDSPPIQFSVNNGPPEGTTPFTVNITLPPAGVSLSGIAPFGAQTSVDATETKFIITGQALTEPHVLLAESSGGARTWNANFRTTDVPDGTYSVVARSKRSTGEEVNSPSNTFSIANQANTAPFSISLVTPAPTASISGRTELRATTIGTASSVTFTATFGSASIPLTFMASPGADAGVWTAFWETADAANGTYSLRATAVSPAGQTVGTGPITVAVNNSTAEPELTPAIASPEAAASVSGTVEMHATTNVAADSLVFIVRGPDNRIIASLPASHDAERKAWSAAWDSRAVDNGTYFLSGKAVKGTVQAETPAQTMGVSNPEEPSDLAVTVVAPRAAATLSGTVQFRATTNIAASAVEFIIGGPDGGQTLLNLVAAGNDERTTWTVGWDTTRAANGTYSFTVEATKDGATVSTQPVTVAVSNSIQNAMAASLVSPRDGASLRGVVRLIASTSLAADSLEFTLKPASGDPILIDGSSDTLKKVWAADWDSDSVPNGSYILSAAAMRGTVRAATGTVTVSVSNEAGTETHEETGTPATGPDGEETSTAPPAEEGPQEMIATFVTPRDGAAVSGSVPVSLKVMGRAGKVTFSLRSTDRNETVGARDGVFSVGSAAWGLIWNTDRLKDGNYDILAVATDASGQRAEARVAVIVANEAPEEERLPSDPIIIIPREVAVEHITELPEGTTSLLESGKEDGGSTLEEDVKANLDAVAGVESGLERECADRGVRAEKCEQFLAFSHQTSECREAGIVTKEECVNFLNLKHGGRPAECEGRTVQECREITARLTSGLLSNERLDAIEDAVIDRIGEVIRIAPRTEGEGPDGREHRGDELIEDYVPFRSRGELGLRVHAAHGYADVGGLGVRQVSAVLLVDTDGDGLPDDFEERLGTDPKNADTDGDGFSDWTEVKNGYNPLGEGKLADDARIAPIDRAIIAGAPLEQPTTEGEIDPSLHVDGVNFDETGADDEHDTRLEGRSEPGSTLTIFIYSYLPVVLTTTADGDGNWSYDLEGSLTDGQHEAYVTVTDDTGKIKGKSNPLSFFVSGAQAASSEEYFGATEAAAAENAAVVTADAPVRQAFRWYGFAVAGLILVALIAIGLYMLRRMKNSGGGPTV